MRVQGSGFMKSLLKAMSRLPSVWVQGLGRVDGFQGLQACVIKVWRSL